MNESAKGYGYAPQATFTVPQFCGTHNVSKTHLYALFKAGRGPRTMKVGRRTLISAEAAADWRRAMEQATDQRVEA